jgi:ParB family chromosome partitioning protein
MIKKGLGKGLDALFQSSEDASSIAEYIKHEILKEIKISDIDQNINQPRKLFDEQSLTELADSIKQHGVLSPIIVKSNGARYQIVAGERRWRAARLAGLKVIPAIIKDSDEAQSMEIALIENLQRENLNPIEEAEGIRQLMVLMGLTQEQVAQRLGKSRPAVSNSLRLLTLPDEFRNMILKNELTPGHARALLAIDDDKSRATIAKKTIEAGLNVRQLEELVKRHKQLKGERKPKTAKPASLSTIESALEEYLGTKVEILHGRKKGAIYIEYYDEGDLERIIDMLIK